MMRILLLLAWVAVVPAFVPAPHWKHHHHQGGTTTSSNSRLLVSWWDRDDDSYRAAQAHNIMRTDLRQFLTQRALQSFCHLLGLCRDPHTIRWIEEFGDLHNLQLYHGTGAINVTKFPNYASILYEMMEQPEDVVVVKTKKRSPFGNVGTSDTAGNGIINRDWAGTRKRKKNPFLKEDRHVEFRIDIDPTSLVNRILAVREQIGDEWMTDLETLRYTNELILESYQEKIQQARQEEGKRKEEEEEEEEALLAEGYDNDNHKESTVDKKKKNPLEKDSTIMLEAFERNAMYMLRNANAGAAPSSPLRQSSFDLLCLLATQESIHRVLRYYQDAGPDRQVSFEWFRQYYIDRVADTFDGHANEMGRADDFLEELLLTPPAIITGSSSSSSSSLGLVDPMRIAEDIIEMRSQVAMEWKEIASQTKQDHMEIRRQLLAKQMIKWGTQPPEFGHQDEVKEEIIVTNKKEKSETVAAAAATEEEPIGEFQ